MQIPRDLASRTLSYPSFEAWHAARLHPELLWIGGTAAAAICEVGYDSPWALWSEYRGVAPPPKSAGELRDLERGRDLEALIAQFYCNRVGAQIDRSLCRVQHPEHPWAVYSRDGFTWRDGAIGLLEIKSCRDKQEYGDNGTVIPYWQQSISGQIIPVRTAVQCFWGMFVTGLPWTDVAVALPCQSQVLELRVIRLYRDEKMQTAIFRKVQAWRQRHLVEGREPPCDESDAMRLHLAARYPEAGEPLRPVASPEEEEAVLAFLEAHAAAEEEAKRRDRLRNELMGVIGQGRGLALSDGRRVVLTRTRGKAPSLRVYGVEKPINLKDEEAA